MKTKKIKGRDIVVPKGSAFKIETKPDMIKLHTNLIAVGKRGAAKSTSVINLVRMLVQDNSIQRCFLITPSYYSNKSLFDTLGDGLSEEDIYEDASSNSVRDVMKKVEQEADDYEEAMDKLKKYKKFKKKLEEGGLLNDEELLEWFEEGSGQFTPPTHRWNFKKPGLALIVDDAQNTNMYKTNSPFLNLTTRHRHIGKMKKEGGALGLSIFNCIQNYTANGGIPRCCRNNATHLLVFKQKDEKELDKIFSECSGEVEKEKFFQAYEKATDEPFSFLLIDLHKKEHHPSMFRKKFNEFLMV